MASLQSTVDLIFNAVDDSSRGINSALQGINKFSDGVGNITAPIANLTKGILAFEAGLIAAGVAMAGVAANESQKFSQAFAEIGTLVQGPNGLPEGFESLRDSILEYAQGSTQSLDQINEAVYNSISAGVEWDKVIDRLNVSEKLSVAGRADLADTTRVLNLAVEAYSESNLTAAQASDTLFTTVQSGVTTLPELAQSLGDIIGIAAAAGVPFSDLSAAIAVLTKTQDSAASITALKNVITTIISPSAEAAKKAEELGIAFDAQTLKTEGLQAVLLSVLNATEGNTEAQAALFGNVRGLTGLLSLARDEGGKFAAALEAQSQSAGATDRAFAEMIKTLDTGVDAFKVLLINIGKPLEQAFINSKAAVTEFTNAIANAAKDGDNFGPLINLISGYAKAIEDTLTAIARNLPKALDEADLSGFERGIRAVVDALGAFTGGIDLTTAEGLTDAITAAGNAFEKLGIFTAGVIEGIGPFIQKAGELASKFLEIDGSTIGLIGQFAGITTAVDALLPAFNSVLLSVIALNSGLPALAAGVKGLGAGLAATATGGAAALGGALGTGGLLAVIGKLAGAAGVGLLSFELTKFGSEATGLNLVVNDLVDKFTGLDKATEDLLAPVPALAQETGLLAVALGKVGATSEQLASIIDDTGKAIAKVDLVGPILKSEEALNGLGKVDLSNLNGEEISRLQAELLRLDRAIDPVTGDIRDLNKEYSDAAFAANNAENSAQGFKKEIIDGVTVYKQAGPAFQNTSKQIEESLSDAQKAAAEFQLELAKLESAERIVQIEVAGQIATAQIESDARRIEAAFESVNTGIKSTGDLLGGAIDAFAGLESGLASMEQRNFLQRVINKELEFREQAFATQERLINQQIRYFQEQVAFSRQARREGISINVQANNLGPPLQALFQEVLGLTAAEMITNNAQFLVGAAQPS